LPVQHVSDENEDFIDMNQADSVNNYPNIFRNLPRTETIRLYCCISI